MSRKKVVKSQEVIDQEILENRLKSCRENFINEPTIQYSVNQKVVWGGHKETTILESIDSGKIYKVRVVSTCTNYGNPYDVESVSYAVWHDLTPLNNMNAPIISYSDDYHLNYMSCDIYSVLNYYYDFGIDMNPIYQRGNVWTMEDKVSLINSIFNNIDIGKMVIVNLPFKTGKNFSYEVLDGKQRINAIMEYYENRYAYKGKTFYELHPRDQGHFTFYRVSLARTENPMTDEQKYKYFLKLNVGGRAQDPAHLEYVKKLYENTKK
jgi:hypothetical protein